MKNELPRLDKSQLTIGLLSEPPDDLDYWLSRTPEERFAGIEVCRQVLYGYDPATTRLLEVVDRTSG